jgi:O-antigen/teichoic acid export membrane protein
VSSSLLQATELPIRDRTSGRLRVWGIRSALSILDQGLTSGAGLVLNLLLARWLSKEVYGAFAVAFATVLFLFGFHTALLLEPMSVMGPASYSTDMAGYFRTHLKLHAVVVVGLSAILGGVAVAFALTGQARELAWALGGSALALPFLLLLWLVRRMCYVVHRPSMACWGSATYFIFVVVGLFLLHSNNRLSPFSAFLLIGTASVPAVAVLLRRLGVIGETFRQGPDWRQVASENWAYGRWLVAGTVLFTVTTQIQTYLAAVFLGLVAAGTLRALQIPSLVMVQIVTAFGLLVLPSMAGDFGSGKIERLRKKAFLVSAFLAGLALAYAAALAVFSAPLEHLLFHDKFSADGWLIPAFGLIPVFAGFGTGFSLALRAAQKPHCDLLANAISAPAGLISAFILIRIWGVAGAGLSMIIGFAVYALVFFFSFRKWSKSTAVGSVVA